MLYFYQIALFQPSATCQKGIDLKRLSFESSSKGSVSVKHSVTVMLLIFFVTTYRKRLFIKSVKKTAIRLIKNLYSIYSFFFFLFV